MDRLERLVTDHVMRLSGELRGDPYANRYIGYVCVVGREGGREGDSMHAE